MQKDQGTTANDNALEAPANDNNTQETPFNDKNLNDLHKVAEHFEAMKDDDEGLKREVLKFAEWLNRNAVFKKFRAGWDKLPRCVQWALRTGEHNMNVITPSVLNTLIDIGLLTYKGHASAEDKEEEIKESRAWQQKKNQWVLTLASFFIPEVKAVLPFLVPIQKLENAKASVIKDVSAHLNTLKIENSTEGQEERTVDEKKHHEKVPLKRAA